MPSLSRRRLLSLGVAAGGATLVLGAIPLALTDEAAVLRAVAGTLFDPGDTGAVHPDTLDVAGAVLRYLEAAPWSMRAQVRGLLRAVQAEGLVYGAPFTSLDGPARRQMLQGWAESPLYPRRLMANGLKQLCAVGYYQHDATWAHLGYDGPLVGRSG